MTLIAAYRPHGVPILLGDFLITGGGRESSNKKIYKISPNFVIAWTGRKFLGAPILRQLFDRFENSIVTYQEVDNFLTNYQGGKSNFNELFLVGWVVEENVPRCFLWNYAFTGMLFEQPYCLAGSGERRFEELLTTDRLRMPWGEGQGNIELAIKSTLILAAELYSDENLGKMNRREGFGYGYELLYFNGNEFEYLDNIAFMGMDIFIDPSTNSGKSVPYEFRYWYHSLGECSFLQVRNLRTGNLILEPIKPIFHRPMRDAAVEFIAGSFRANYYCFYFRMQSSLGELYQGSLVLPEVAVGPSRYEKYIDDNYRFEFEPEYIKGLYEQMKGLRQYREQNTTPLGWGGAITEQQIDKAGSFFKFQPDQTNKCVVGGLVSVAEWSFDYRTIDYAIMCCEDGTLQLYEKGIAVGPLGQNYITGDILNMRIGETETEPAQSRVAYFQNEELLYISESLPKFPLKMVCLAKEEGASISGFEFYNPK